MAPTSSTAPRAGVYFLSLLIFALAGCVIGWVGNAYLSPAAKDEHKEHGHEHGDDKNSLVLTDQARQNIDLELGKLEPKSFSRTITVPGMVAERPGKTALHVPAPFGGMVTKIFVEPGIAVRPGDELFELTLMHEDVVDAQGNLLKTVEEMDVTKAEISRLQGVVAVAGKSLLERQYELQKLDANLRSQRQALRLHGLGEDQIATIEQTRKLLRSVTIKVPGTSDETEGPTYQVEILPVNLGQHVEAGADLICLADHALLLVEGNAFEQDLAAVQALMNSNSPITAVFNSRGERQEVAGLKINYIAPTLNSSSRTLAFFARLPNELRQDETREGRRHIDWKYRPGQRVELEVPVEEWKDQLVVPISAIALDGPETYVFQANGGSFVRRPVHLKYSNPQLAVLANDGSVFPGDQIAMTGAQQLQIALKNKAAGPVDPHAGHSH